MGSAIVTNPLCTFPVTQDLYLSNKKAGLQEQEPGKWECSCPLWTKTLT